MCRFGAVLGELVGNPITEIAHELYFNQALINYPIPRFKISYTSANSCPEKKICCPEKSIFVLFTHVEDSVSNTFGHRRI